MAERFEPGDDFLNRLWLNGNTAIREAIPQIHAQIGIALNFGEDQGIQHFNERYTPMYFGSIHGNTATLKANVQPRSLPNSAAEIEIADQALWGCRSRIPLWRNTIPGTIGVAAALKNGHLHRLFV